MVDTRRFGSAKDVADLTGGMIQAHRAYRLAADGVLPAGVVVRIGRKVYFDLPRLVEWIEAGGGTFEGGWRKSPAA